MLIKSVTLNGVLYLAGTPKGEIPAEWLDRLEKSGCFKEVKPLKVVKETK